MAETKKTTKAVAKPAAKTTTKKEVTKPAAKTSNELSVTGNKKVETLMKEFNKQFPFIRINIYSPAEKIKREKGESISSVDASKTIAAVRTKINPGSITITGNKKVKTLEKEFDDVFGLYAEVSFTTKEGKRYYTRSSAKGITGDVMEARIHGDEMTLSALNRQCEADGCKKGEWC